MLTKVLRYGCFPGYDENGKKLRMLIDNARRGGRITEVQYQLLYGIRRVHYVRTCGLPTSNDGVEASEQDGGVEVASSSKEDGVESSSKAASSFQPAARKRLHENARKIARELETTLEQPLGCSKPLEKTLD